MILNYFYKIKEFKAAFRLDKVIAFNTFINKENSYVLAVYIEGLNNHLSFTYENYADLNNEVKKLCEALNISPKHFYLTPVAKEDKNDAPAEKETEPEKPNQENKAEPVKTNQEYVVYVEPYYLSEDERVIIVYNDKTYTTKNLSAVSFEADKFSDKWKINLYTTSGEKIDLPQESCNSETFSSMYKIIRDTNEYQYLGYIHEDLVNILLVKPEHIKNYYISFDTTGMRDLFIKMSNDFCYKITYYDVNECEYDIDIIDKIIWTNVSNVDNDSYVEKIKNESEKNNSESSNNEFTITDSTATVKLVADDIKGYYSDGRVKGPIIMIKYKDDDKDTIVLYFTDDNNKTLYNAAIEELTKHNIPKISLRKF